MPARHPPHLRQRVGIICNVTIKTLEGCMARSLEGLRAVQRAAASLQSPQGKALRRQGQGGDPTSEPGQCAASSRMEAGDTYASLCAPTITAQSGRRGLRARKWGYLGKT